MLASISVQLLDEEAWMNDWVKEKLHVGYGQSFLPKNLVYSNDSEFQRIDIIDTDLWGRVMLLDGIVQTTEKDEFIYHEMFAHVPMFAHAEVSTVLIVGGGDGGLLREVLKHKSVTKVVLVEIDKAVIDLCSQYFPGHSLNSWQDPRVEVVIADGKDYIATTELTFDLILSDSTDPIGPGEVLFTSDFYYQAISKLTDKGILVTQNGVSFLQTGELEQTYVRMKQYAKYNGFYHANVPTYIGGNMSFAWASNGIDCSSLLHDVIATRLNASDIATSYYNAQIHSASFAQPNYLKNLLEAR
jgi:spermidine synthase